MNLNTQKRNALALAWMLLCSLALSACGAAPLDVSSTAAPASVSLSSASYSVAQNASALNVTVARSGSANTAISIDYATKDGTAVANNEYTPTQGALTWAANDTAPKTLSIPVSNARPFAGSKTFSVVLSNPSAAATIGNPAESTVTIVGDATVAVGTVQLSASTYTVSQGAGTLSVTVNRVGGSSGAISVAYATSSGTAVTGTDFTAASGTLQWADGDATSKTLSVAISNATPFSGTRNFDVSLSSPGGGATLGNPSTASVTITGDASAATGTLQLAAGTYTVAQNAGSVSISVNRVSGSSGAVSVGYATSNGTAAGGTDYTAASGTLQWAGGDTTAKSFSVPISNATPFTGSRSFSVTLSSPSAGALIGSPGKATVTINGGAAATGTVQLSAASYSIAQGAGTLAVTVTRAGGSSGAASVHYATSNGTATSGSDYTSASGTLNWSDADAASKTFSIAISNATPFTGSKTLTVTLSAATGSALGTPATATVSINGATCSKSASSWTTTGAFDSFPYGNYVVNNNNWGGTPNQQFWSNNESCWGVTTTATKEQNSVSSYPSVTRGWSQNGSIMQQLSKSGTNDWTTKSGMGIAVTALTKAKVHWAFNAPTSTGSRWLGLMDNYFHASPTPSYTEFPPVVDLMIDESIMDQVISGQPANLSSYYAATASQDHATTVTLGGVKYLVYIDDVDETAYSQPAAGGHTIHLFELPTTYTDSSGPSWGVQNGTHDLKAIVDFFRQSHPVDDAGLPLKFANGSTVAAALISSNLYLTAINAGWEIDVGTVFTNTAFCVSMQNEADCP